MLKLTVQTDVALSFWIKLSKIPISLSLVFTQGAALQAAAAEHQLRLPLMWNRVITNPRHQARRDTQHQAPPRALTVLKLWKRPMVAG